jgi:DNA polymerase II small subunit
LLEPLEIWNQINSNDKSSPEDLEGFTSVLKGQVGTMDKSDIIKAVMEKEYQISPEAVELIKSSNSPESLLKYVLSTVNNSVIVIGAENIDLESFAAHERASKPIYSENEINPGFDTLTGKLSSDEMQTTFLKAMEFLSEPSTLSPKSDEFSLEPDIPVSVPCQTTKEPHQNPVPDSISVPETTSQQAPETQSGNDSSEEILDSYLSSGSLSSLRAVPESVFSSPSSLTGERSSSSFIGNGNSLLSSPSNTISRTDPFSSIAGRGSSSSSRDEEYIHFPGMNPVTVISDISGHSTCIGEYTQFVQYFRDRYSRLSEIIRSRVNARPMESLKKRSFRRGGGEWGSEEISIIGMVSDISSTTNGHKVLSLEDPTGSFSVLIRNTDKELFELASKILLDEVIGVTGSVTNDGNLMMAAKIIQPDVPNNVQRRTGSHGKIVLISDVHVGSSQFLEDAWLDFLDFLKGKSDSEVMRELAASIRYLVVAGDLVDGIGIYPDQEKELDILDVYDQYRKAAEYFREIPEHIRVIISPGNHDAVRQAEPQPALPERIQADFPPNVIFVGNPALLDLDGVRILIYHGRSIDDLVASIPGVSYQEPAGAVLEMVKRRHLAPTYGSRVSISPEKMDYFVIDPVPDIIHTGHVHTLGVQRYKNVLLVNSGTWQGQTEFQKRVNLMPVPARVPIVDLADFTYKILTFD